MASKPTRPHTANAGTPRDKLIQNEQKKFSAVVPIDKSKIFKEQMLPDFLLHTCSYTSVRTNVG